MMLTYSDTCKHCGKNIIWRSKIQGWLHAGGSDRKCSPSYAEPKGKYPNG